MSAASAATVPAEANGAPERIVVRALTSPLVLAFLFAVGIALRLWQYAANASLWVDEAAVARNVVDRPLTALFKPLDYGQVAPWGFLALEKLSITVLGNHEYALRLFPFLCGALSLFLFYAAAKRVLRDIGVPIAVAMFAAGVPFLYFPSQVKPYSCDVAAALFVLVLALRIERGAMTGAQAVAIAAAGAIVPWFSSASVFVLAGTGGALIVVAWMRRDARRIEPTIAVVGVWAVAAALAVLAGRASMTSADRVFMNRFWAAGFAPMPPHGIQDLLWPLKQLASVFGVFSSAPPALDGGLHYRNPLLMTALCLVGAVCLARRNPQVALVIFAPVLVAFGAAAAHLYPFSGRLAVFLIPFLLLAIGAATEDARSAAPAVVRDAGLIVAAIVVLIAFQAVLRNHPPDTQEDLRSVLTFVHDRRLPDDRMYVYYGAGQAFLYYAPRFGLEPDMYSVGTCARHQPIVNLTELDKFRGDRRLWTIFSHSLQGGREIRLLTGYLDRIGHRLDAFPATNAPLGAGAYAFLYDLSDARRLASTSRDRYPVTPEDPDTSWLCYGTMTPLKLQAD